MTTFQSLLDSVQPGDRGGRYSAFIDESWLQGRTAFGGLSASLVAAALQQQVSADRIMRALSVAFVGPATPGEHSIETRILREGGSVTHCQGELICDGNVATTVTAAFGKARASGIAVSGPAMPAVPGPDRCEPIPFIEDLTPAFTRHFDMRFTHGAPPLAGADEPDFGLWVRFREPQPLGLPELVAIADVPPMPGMNMIRPPGVGSSLTWYLDFNARLPHLGNDTWFYFDYTCDAAGDGYFNIGARIWNQAGEPVMFSRQIATIFEK